MSYYEEVYLKRLNRYGTNFQDRIARQREENFQRQLMKSIYRVEFEFDGAVRAGELTRNSQDQTKTLRYLLTEVDVEIPGGTVLMINEKEDADGIPYMIFWKEEYEAKGYNRYIVLKMTHWITWWYNNEEYHSWAYMFGQKNNMLKDELKSRSRMDTLYGENLKSDFFIMPLDKNLHKDDYFEVTRHDITEAYRVTGFDRQSTDGVMYVTVDPLYKYDHHKRLDYTGDETYTEPQKEETNTADDYYWSMMREVDEDGRKHRD